MFYILVASQIVNLKMIEDVLVFIKCYQCGGETLGPVVKHSVCDSSGSNRLSRYLFPTRVQFQISRPTKCARHLNSITLQSSPFEE